MGCVHDSVKTVMQRELDHDVLGNSFLWVVDIEEVCNVCNVILYKASNDEKRMSYLRYLVKLQEQ